MARGFKHGTYSRNTLDILQLLHTGNYTLQQIADLLPHTTRSMVTGVNTRYNAGVYDKLLKSPRMTRQLAAAEPPKPLAPPSEPSLAMVRLAQFDPVIARALNKRRGEGT